MHTQSKLFVDLFDQDERGQELVAQQIDTEPRVLTKYVSLVGHI